MHRGVPGSTQVVVIWTSPELRRTSCRCKVGSSSGPIDITTFFFAHLRRAMGTTLRISELLPVVANPTLPRGFDEARSPGLASWPDAAPTGVVHSSRRPDAAQAAIAPRRTALLLTGASICPDRASLPGSGRLRSVLRLRRAGELDPHVGAAAVRVSSG